MFTAGFVLAGLGLYAIVLGGLWLLVKAFKQSVLWGLLSLFIPLANVVFGLKYWSEGGRPLLIHVGGFLAMIGGGFLLAMTMAEKAQAAALDAGITFQPVETQVAPELPGGNP